MNASDCPDGLARCSGGVVQVSELASIPRPCKGTPEQCVCPWRRLAECERGCVADEVVVVIDRDRAASQLCSAAPDAGPLTRPASATPSGCEEGVGYRCVAGAVVSCADRSVVALCTRGCSAEGADIGDDEPVSREAAFAILCSR